MNAFITNFSLAGTNQLAAVGLAALLNTLWYAAAVVGLTWAALRFLPRVNAATRYWVWTAVLAFIFVLPFLPGLVLQARTALAADARIATSAAAAPLATVPASSQDGRELAPVTLTVSAAPGSSPWPLWLAAVWILAAGWQLTRLAAGVVSVRRLKAGAKAGNIAISDVGPTLASASAGAPVRECGPGLVFKRRVQVLVSDAVGSPVAVGCLHPAIIVPPELLARLEEGERRNVLLHELGHLARYDDWLSLAARAVGALLALHPLAPFVLSRIEREREMACDDFVVEQTGSATGYARSLARLHDLRWKTGTRLLASALLGRKVSLADRIESLLRRGRDFSARPSLANLSLSALLLTLLLGAGALMPAWIAVAQTDSGLSKSACADLPKSFCANLATVFEVASIRPAKPGERGSTIQMRPDIFSATNAPLDRLILSAYRIKPEQLEGLPSWAKSRRYTIKAEPPPGMAKDFKAIGDMPPDERKQALAAYGQGYREMLQWLLADRFKLKVHRVSKQLPVYELVVAKGGSRLKAANTAEFAAHHFRRNLGTWTSTRPGLIDALGASPAVLAKVLSPVLGRIVIDKTGITGRYDFKLTWVPSAGEGGGMSIGPNAANDEHGELPVKISSSGPSIFTALKEQLGLELKSAKGPVEVLVVDHIEPPTPN